MTPLTVRGYRPADAVAVAALTVAAFGDGPPLSASYRDFLLDVDGRHRASSGLLVAELAGSVVGSVMLLRPGDPEWEDRPIATGDSGFRALAVLPHVRGHGVGSRLVTAAVEWAIGRDSKRMVITTLDWMATAQRLYLRHGFTHRPDLDVMFDEGPGRVLTKDLAADAAEHFPPPGQPPEVLPDWRDVWVAPPAYLERERRRQEA